tara:strand:- start:30 stop:1094 length:1065 start_codon:yes stop_codon:yes gene_type:complete
MKEKKALNQLISLLPMAAVVTDNKGVIEEANLVFKEKFNFNRISKKNRVKLQTFLNFDITNFLQRLSVNDMTISTYDYKFIDFNENEVFVDLHFKSISKNKILMTLDQKDTHKSYYAQSSKILTDMFMSGFIKSISRNISSPVTNLLGAIELIKVKNNSEEYDRLMRIISDEGDKIKNYLTMVNSFNSNITLENEFSNIHKCLNKSFDLIDKNLIKNIYVNKDFDPSIPKISYKETLLIKCFYNILINFYENKKCTEIKVITKINHNTFIKSEELQKVLKLAIHVKIIGNGESLDENIEKFMFYPFITSKVNSEGLGLTYVNSILSSFGGYLNYEKERNLSTFNLFFPINNNRR